MQLQLSHQLNQLCSNTETTLSCQYGQTSQCSSDFVLQLPRNSRQCLRDLANDKTHMYRCLPYMQTCTCNDASRKATKSMPQQLLKVAQRPAQKHQFQQVFISMSQDMTNLVKHHIITSTNLGHWLFSEESGTNHHSGMSLGVHPDTGQYMLTAFLAYAWFEHIMFCLHISMIFSDT